MCGLVGIFGDLFPDHLKVFKQALVADYFRGKHSTGITCVKASGDVFNKKLALDPINFLDLKSVDDNLVTTNTLIMGHNRHATLGGVNAANAHPFEHGNITLMHNGTLNNKAGLQTKFDSPIFGTDSELVCWLINEHGPEVTIPLLQGAFALTWYDASDSTFNFIRNEERPMTLAVDVDVVLYASERAMLEWIMHRNNLKLADFSFFTPEKGKHYKFKYSARVVSCEVKELELHVFPKYVAPVYSYQGGYQGGGGGPIPQSYSADDRFEQYKSSFGGNTKRNDIVFAYIDKVLPRAYQGETHFDLEMSLVASPYTAIKVFYVAYARYPDISEGFVVRGKVNACYLAGREPYFILDTEFNLINEVGDDFFGEYEALASLEADEVVGTSNIVMLGEGSTLITVSEFRDATKKGCHICQQPIDSEKDIQDVQVTMIIGEETAVCEYCVDIYENQLQIGVN
jgi:hypothetical protein